MSHVSFISLNGSTLNVCGQHLAEIFSQNSFRSYPSSAKPSSKVPLSYFLHDCLELLFTLNPMTSHLHAFWQSVIVFYPNSRAACYNAFWLFLDEFFTSLQVNGSESFPIFKPSLFLTQRRNFYKTLIHNSIKYCLFLYRLLTCKHQFSTFGAYCAFPYAVTVKRPTDKCNLLRMSPLGLSPAGSKTSLNITVRFYGNSAKMQIATIYKIPCWNYRSPWIQQNSYLKSLLSLSCW